MEIFLVILIAYLSGSIPFGLILTKIFGKIDIAPTILSKVNTDVQILALLLVMVTLLDIPQLMKTDYMLDMVFIIVGIFSILSGVDYVISWIRRARSSWRTGEE